MQTQTHGPTLELSMQISHKMADYHQNYPNWAWMPNKLALGSNQSRNNDVIMQINTLINPNQINPLADPTPEMITWSKTAVEVIDW